MHRRLPLFALFVPLAACGSAPEPAPLRPPTLETGVRYFAGTVLSGRRPDAAAADRLDPARAELVRCDVTYVERMPWDALDAASTATSMIVSSAGVDPIRPAAELGTGIRIGTGDAAAAFLDRLEDGTATGRTVPMFELRGALSPDVTTAFYAQALDPVIADTGEAVRRLVAMLVSRDEGGDAATVALLLEDLQPELHVLPDEDDPLDDRRIVKRELMVLDQRLEAGDPPLAIAIPSAFDPSGGRGFVARIELRAAEPDDPLLADALAHCADDLRREGTRAAEDASWATEVELRRRSLTTAIGALELARQHRPALVFLAGATDAAPLALDLALSGDDATLGEWANLVTEQTGDDGEASGQDALAWLLERTAFGLLSGRLDRDELSEELRGMLARHAGEAGLFPGTISGLLARATDPAAFERLLIEENLGFLEAPDPAARVRAHDWLANRGLAPPEYDPLAERAARQAALDAHQRAAAAADGTATEATPAEGTARGEEDAR